MSTEGFLERNNLPPDTSPEQAMLWLAEKGATPEIRKSAQASVEKYHLKPQEKQSEQIASEKPQKPELIEKQAREDWDRERRDYLDHPKYKHPKYQTPLQEPYKESKPEDLAQNSQPPQSLPPPLEHKNLLPLEHSPELPNEKNGTAMTIEKKEQNERFRELDRSAMWVLVNAILVTIAWFAGLIHHSIAFYVLLGVAILIAIGRRSYVPVIGLWVKVRTFISEVLVSFLTLGLLWRAGLWIVHRFTHG